MNIPIRGLRAWNAELLLLVELLDTEGGLDLSKALTDLSLVLAAVGRKVVDRKACSAFALEY